MIPKNNRKCYLRENVHASTYKWKWYMVPHSINKTCSNCRRSLLSCPGTVVSVIESGTLPCEIDRAAKLAVSVEFYFPKIRLLDQRPAAGND